MIWPHFGHFYPGRVWNFLENIHPCPFLHFLGSSGLFLGLGSGPKTFWDLLTLTNNFYFGNIALFCFFETFSVGVGVGWLDIAILLKTKSSAFDFDWRLWVHQFLYFSSSFSQSERLWQMIVGIKGKCIVTAMKDSVLYFLFSVYILITFTSNQWQWEDPLTSNKQNREGTLFTPDRMKIVLSLFRMISFEHNFILHIIVTWRIRIVVSFPWVLLY